MFTLRVRYYGGRWEPYLAPDGAPVLFPSSAAARFRASLLLEFEGAQAVHCLEGRRITNWWVRSVTGALLDVKAIRAARPSPVEAPPRPGAAPAVPDAAAPLKAPPVPARRPRRARPPAPTAAAAA